MKQFYLVLTFGLLLAAMPAAAQQGLHVDPVFKGSVIGADRLIETMVKGNKLKAYNLTLFRSLKATVSDEEARRIENLVQQDIRLATDKETLSRGGQLVYALLRVRSDEKSNHYLCYQRSPYHAQWQVTLVYLEGQATLTDLKNIFSN